MVEPVRCPECNDVFYRSRTVPPNPLIRIDALLCHQKGKAYLLTDLAACDLDMLTDVPRFNWDLSYEDMARLILQYGFGLQQVEAWQRDLIENNLSNIAAWWEESSTNLVNGVVIGFKQGMQRPIEGHGQIGSEPVRIHQVNSSTYGTKELITIEIDNWLSSVCPAGHHAEAGEPTYFDACPDHDCEYHTKTWRPAFVIDGQHRIKGIQRTPSFGSTVYHDVNKEPLPVAILGFSEDHEAEPITSSEQARIFTEISGKAHPLEWEHKLFLFYVFKTGTAEMNMSEPTPPATNPLRKAYETVLRLAEPGTANNPFQNRIRILPPRRTGGRTTVLSFERALDDWFESWFSPGKIWQNTTTQDAAREIINLANAIRSVWSGTGPTSGSPYWQTLGLPARGGIFSHTLGGDMSSFLRLFFDIYPEIRNQVTTPSQVNFQNLFRRKLYTAGTPVGRVAWDGPGWDTIRSPDRNYALLRAAVRDVITGGTKVTYDLANIPSRPADFNAYINLDASVYEVTTSLGVCPSTGTVIRAGIPYPNEIEVSWRTPLLSFSTVRVTVLAQTGTISTRFVDVTPGDVKTISLKQVDGDFVAAAGTSNNVEIRAENHKGEQDPPFTIILEFP